MNSRNLRASERRGPAAEPIPRASTFALDLGTGVFCGKYVSPNIAQILVRDLSGDSDKPPHATLSKREFQIFYKLAGGMTVSKIAEELFLSVKTVSTYRARILEKMQMTSNADLTHYAVRNNLID